MDKSIEEVLKHASQTKSDIIDEKYFQKTHGKLVKQDVEDKKHKRQLQRDFAGWGKWVVSIWLIFVALLLLAHGFSFVNFSDYVLITILGTTTICVLSLCFIIIKGLFSRE